MKLEEPDGDSLSAASNPSIPTTPASSAILNVLDTLI
jgi:hypothetical protein